MKYILQFIINNKEYIVIAIFLLVVFFFLMQIIKFNALKPFIYILNNT